MSVRDVTTAMRRRPRSTIVSVVILASSAAALVASGAIQSAERDRALERLGALGADASFVQPLPTGGEVSAGAAGRAAGLDGVSGAIQFQRLQAEAFRTAYDVPRIVTPVLAVEGAGRYDGLRPMGGRVVFAPDVPLAAAGVRAAAVLGITEVPQLISIDGESVLVTAVIAGDPVLEILSRAVLVDAQWARSRFAPAEPAQLLVRSSRPVEDHLLELAANPIEPERVVPSRPDAIVSARRLAQSTAGSIARVLGWALVVAGALTTGMTLFNSARSRTHELAIRRIFGSGRLHLAGLPTTEGIFVGLAGGIIGSALGEAAAAMVAARSGALYAFDPRRAGLAITTMILAVVAASLIPAIFVARIDPVDALGVE